MTRIQPSHDAVLGGDLAAGGSAAIAYGTPTVDLARAVVHHHQLAQHPYRVPLGPLGPGLIGLGVVIGRVELLPTLHVGGDQNLTVGAKFVRNFHIFVERTAKDVIEVHPLPLVVVDIAYNRGIAGDDTQNETVPRSGQTDLLTLQGCEATAAVLVVRVAVQPLEQLCVVNANLKL